MVTLKFKVVDVDIINPTDYPLGIVKNSGIWEENPANNYGGSMTIADTSVGGVGGGRNAYHSVIEIQMPSKGDLDGSDEIIAVEIELIITGSSVTDATFMVIGIVEIPDNFDEGSGGAGWCNWTEYIDSVAWTRGDGGCKSRRGINAEDGVVYDTFRIDLTAIPAGFTFDLTDALGLGDKKRFAMFVIDDDVSSSVGQDDVAWIELGCKEDVLAERPILKITYRDYAPEAFTDKDSALTIEPNPDNPEQPLLKWGGVKDSDFVDFKLYRETSAITTVAALTPIATITSPADQEYIDDSALTDGQDYYYLVIAEDGNNTGDDATFSNQIEWTKPLMTVKTVSAAGAVVGSSKTVTITSASLIKRIYVAWGDGSTSWYDFEVAALTQTADHIYSKVLAAFYPYVRMEDVDGFWSDLLATTNQIAFTDAAPLTKLRVSVKKAQLGDYVTLDASLCQPAGSNVTITKYEFKRDAADSYQDNLTDPVYTYKTGTGGGEYPQTIGVKTASVRITLSTTTLDIDTTTYELETGTATPLVFSRDTKIHELNHDLSLNKTVEVPLESAGVAYEFMISRPPERVTLVGTSNHPNTGTDIAIIRNAWLSNTYVSFTMKSEMEGVVVTYSGKIDGDISLGQSYGNKQSWTFPLRIITRTEA